MADRAGAENQLRGDVLVAGALRGQPDDLQFLRREAPAGPCPAGRPARPRRGELGLSPVCPRGGTEPAERLQGDAEVDSRVGLALFPAQPLTVKQPGAGLVVEAWHQQYAPSSWEKKWNQKVASVQGSVNEYIQ